MQSMQKLQQVAPRMKAIQAKYKDDKQRRQQEILRFYKENEINPFALFLPLVAQLPVLIGLFHTLRTRCARTSVRGSRRRFATPTPRFTTSRSTKLLDRRSPAMGSMDRAGCSSKA